MTHKHLWLRPVGWLPMLALLKIGSWLRERGISEARSRSMVARLSTIWVGLFAALFLLGVEGGIAATWVWDGGSPDNSSMLEPLNWSPNSVPDNDGTADIFFAGTTKLSPSSDNIDWDFNSITFDLAGPFNVSIFDSDSFESNTLTIGAGGINVLDTPNDQRIFVDGGIVLGAHQTWNVNNIVLTVAESFEGSGVSGPYQFSKSGTGTVYVEQDFEPQSTLILGGTLRLASGVSGNIGVVGPGILEFQTFGGLFAPGQMYTDIITGLSGQIVKEGSGIMTITGSVSGNTATVNNGTLRFGDGGITGSMSGNITNNADVEFDRSNSYQYTRVISGPGTVRHAGIGTLVFTGNNTYTGRTTIDTGTLQVGIGGAAGAIVGNVTNNGTLVFNRSITWTLGGNISGTGNLQQVGTGTTILTGTNTHTGGTTIAAGTLQIGNGGTTGSISRAITNNAALVFNRSDTWTYDGGISGTGNLQQVGTGTTILTGTNTHTGGTTIAAGTLQIGNGGTTGSILGDITNNVTLAFNRSDTWTYGDNISGTGSVQQIGTGTTILTGTNTHTGGTTITAGTLRIGNGGTTGGITGDVINDGVLMFDRSDSVTFGGEISGTGALIKNGNATLTLTGNNTFTGDTTINAGTVQIGNGGTTGSILGDVTNNGTLAFDRSDTVTFIGVISGTGALIKNGIGSVTLTGNHSYAGGTTINAGTLQIGNGGTTGGITGDVINNGTLAFDRSDTVTYSGVISGAGNVVKNGIGTLILTVNNTYAGTTTVNAGTLRIGDGGTTGSIVGNIVNNSNLVFDHVTQHTYAGSLSGVGTTTVAGQGDLTLTGASPAYDGIIRIDGALTVNNTLGGGGSLSLDGNGTLNANASVGLGIQGNDVGTVINVGGNVSLGNAGSFLGFQHAGTLNIGANTVTINSTGFANLGVLTTIAGGELIAPNGVALGVGNNLQAGGTVSGRVAASFGSTIVANGPLTIGDASAVNGFASAGTTNVGDSTVTLLDANDAVFDSLALVTLGDGLGGAGTLAAANGLTLDFGGNITGFGTVDTPDNVATSLINNGNITGNDPNQVITLTGYVKGVGTLDNVDITGTDAPGFSTAAVNRGNVSYNGTLEIEIGGTSPGSGFDQLNHILGAGIAELGGTLDVLLLGGFVPSLGDSFDILTAAGGVNGTFASTLFPDLGALLAMDLFYDTNTVTLTVVPALPGDFDIDGDVDGFDFLGWQRGESPNPLSASDLADWEANYGMVAPLSATSTTVPEPTTGIMLMLGMAAMIFRRDVVVS